MPRVKEWFKPHHITPCPCGLPCLLAKTVIVWIFLTGHVPAITHADSLNDWNFVGRVANSLRPNLIISWSEYAGIGVNVELLRVEDTYERCRIEINLTESWTVQRKKSTRLYLKAPSLTATSLNFTLEVICNTSQGEAQLPVRLSLLKSLQWTLKSPIPQIQIKPIPDRTASRIQVHRMHWRQNSSEEMIILVYNSTHVLQRTTDFGYTDIFGLAPNALYVVCMIPTLQLLRIQAWPCVRYGTPMALPYSFSNPITVRNLHVIGTGAQWAQVAWDVPARTNYGRVIPRSYLIVLRTKEPRACQAKLFYVEAPWIQPTDRQYRRNLVTHVRKKLNQQSCALDKHEKSLTLLGPWPDWEEYSDSGLDELGPVADFTVNLDEFHGSGDLYDLEVWPVVNTGQATSTSVPISLTNEKNDWRIRFSTETPRLTSLLWNIPDRFLNWFNQQRTAVQLEVHIELIGKPNELSNQICFVRGCISKSTNQPYFLPQPPGSPQRLLCQSITVRMQRKRTDYSVEVPCLLPCQMYQIRITPTMSNTGTLDSAPPIAFTGKRRLIRVGPAYPNDSNLPVFSIARNAFLLQLNNGQASTHDMCAVTGYAISIESMDGKSVEPVRLLTTDQLNSPDGPLSSDGDKWTLLVPNPLRNENRTKVVVQNFAVQPGQEVRMTSLLQPKQCFLDCAWSSEKPSMEHWTHPYRGFYGSALSILPQTRGHNLHLTKCLVKTVKSGIRPAACNVPSSLNHTGHLYCRQGAKWGTCALPPCDQMARIRCVSYVKSSVNITSVHIEWSAPSHIILYNSQANAEKPAGYVVLLGTPPTQNYAVECIRATVVYMDDPGAEQSPMNVDDTYIRTLLIICPQFDRSTVRRYPVSLNFDQLYHDTEYQISITPFSPTGQLGSSWIESIRTLLAPPCAPRNLTITNVASRSMRLRWQTIINRYCGAPTSISVNYGRGFYSPVIQMEEQMDLLISPLEACQMYCIELQMLNKAGASPLHSKLCQKTTRDAFTNPPVLKSGNTMLHHNIAQCLVQNNPLGKTQLDCALRAQLVYSQKCEVHYRVEVSLFGNSSARTYTFSTPELRIESHLEVGFVYLVKVQAIAPDFTHLQDAGPRMSSPIESLWSNQLALFTGTREFQLANVKALVKRPTTKLPSHPPTFTCIPSPTSRNKRILFPSNPEFCLNVDWETRGPTHGLFGYALQVFTQQDTVEQPSETQDLSETIMPQSTTKTERCVSLFWIECEDCLKPYTEANVHHMVFQELDRLLEECGMRDTTMRSFGRLIELGNSRNQIKSMLSHHGEYSFLENQTSLRFVGSLYGLEQAISSTESLRRTARSTNPEQKSDKRGVIRMYVANTAALIPLPEIPWQYKPMAQPKTRMSTVGWTLLVIGLIILLLLLLTASFWFVLRSKQRNRRRHSALQRAAASETFYEASNTSHLEMKKPIIPPKLTKYLWHQPDPILVYEFTAWLDVQAYDNFTAIKDEFRLLRMHALRQERAKRFTHDVGQRPENRLRNKYRNLVPFDHNYVRLSKPWCLSDLNQSDSQSAPTKPMNGTTPQSQVTDPRKAPIDDEVEIPIDENPLNLGPEQMIASDYTNASLIPGRAPSIAYCLVGSDRLPRTYIAAQAPVDHTRGLFWQMIWDHGVKLIVLLTRVRENDKEKCSVYWPGSTGQDALHESRKTKRTVRFGNLTINLRDEINSNTYIKRRFNVRHTMDPNDEERTITQIHMIHWPDFSAPSEEHFGALLYAYWAERRCCGNVEAPVLIHCSAGVGRTGTFICLDQLCQQVRYYLQPDFQPLVQASARVNMDDEPIYANLNGDVEDTATRQSIRLDDDTRNDDFPMQSPKAVQDTEQTAREGNGGSGWQTLLPSTRSATTSLSRSNTRKKKWFGLGRKKSHYVNVYKTVLWLRSHRSYMVQSEDQYLFIYQYLSYFIKQITNPEKIYENIQFDQHGNDSLVRISINQ